MKRGYYDRAYYEAHREEAIEYALNYQRTHREEVNAKNKRWRYENQDKDFQSRLKHRLMANFGMTLQDYKRLWDSQEGKCAACSREMELHGGASASACVDHDHTTNKVRGLICHRCNALAGFLESPARTMVEVYLARNR